MITCSTCKRSRPEIPGVVEPKTCEPCRERKKRYKRQKAAPEQSSEYFNADGKDCELPALEPDFVKPRQVQGKGKEHELEKDLKEGGTYQQPVELDSDDESSDLPELECLLASIESKKAAKITRATSETISRRSYTPRDSDTPQKSKNGENPKRFATLDDFDSTRTMMASAREDSDPSTPKRPRIHPPAPDSDEIMQSPLHRTEKLTITSPSRGARPTEMYESARKKRRIQNMLVSRIVPQERNVERGCNSTDREDSPPFVRNTHQPQMQDPFTSINSMPAEAPAPARDAVTELETRKSDIMLRYLQDQIKGEPYDLTREVLMTLLVQVIDDSKREIHGLKTRLAAMEKEKSELKRGIRDLE